MMVMSMKWPQEKKIMRSTHWLLLTSTGYGWGDMDPVLLSTWFESGLSFNTLASSSLDGDVCPIAGVAERVVGVRETCNVTGDKFKV